MVEVVYARAHAEEILAEIDALESRESAEALKGAAVYIPRRLFPKLDENEFYWVDLIGMKVINQRNEELGIVHGLLDNGVHQVLRVQPPEEENTQKRREILVPFVSKFVGEINQKEGTIAVDWEADY
jgi:16S rRNA processing protein RimM